MPLYPLLLGGIRHVFGDAPRMVAILQAVIDAGTCVLIAALGALISPLVGLIAGILAALSVDAHRVQHPNPDRDGLSLLLHPDAARRRAFPASPDEWLSPLSPASPAGSLSATRPAVAPLLAAAVPLVFVVALVQRRGFAAALAAALLFAVGAAAPIAPVLAAQRHPLRKLQPDDANRPSPRRLDCPAGDPARRRDALSNHGRPHGSPLPAACAGRCCAHRASSNAAPKHDLNGQTNPFQRAAVKSELAREAMARLPLSAYAKAWLEGMVVNLASPALLIDPRVRALPKPSFYNTPGSSLWEKTRAYLFDDPGAYQVLLIVGLVAMLPILVLEAAGFVMLARTSAVGGGIRRRRAGLFPPAQWAGGDAQISTADGAGADRAGRDSTRAAGGASPSPADRLSAGRRPCLVASDDGRTDYLIRSRMLT